MDLQKFIEKSPLQSKKFLGFLMSNLMWWVLIGLAIWHDSSFAVQMTIIIVAGFIQTVYIGGQAAVDAYVRGTIGGIQAGAQAYGKGGLIGQDRD